MDPQMPDLLPLECYFFRQLAHLRFKHLPFNSFKKERKKSRKKIIQICKLEKEGLPKHLAASEVLLKRGAFV